ncbi:MAG: hypothetical protein F7B18_04210 [Desulfurococcales archaeon]|nr:hypothetical protein [Desulfurococcales archaeon]
MRCGGGVKVAGAITAGSLLALGSIALLESGPSLASKLLAGALALVALAGAYYTLASAVWMARGLESLCIQCKPRIHPWIQAASCTGEGVILCYSNVARSMYTVEGEAVEAEDLPGMHCVWALEAEAVGDGVYHGVFLVRGDSVYRVRGVLRVRRIQD